MLMSQLLNAQDAFLKTELTPAADRTVIRRQPRLVFLQVDQIIDIGSDHSHILGFRTTLTYRML